LVFKVQVDSQFVIFALIEILPKRGAALLESLEHRLSRCLVQCVIITLKQRLEPRHRAVEHIQR
jgi:hypothetical protein